MVVYTICRTPKRVRYLPLRHAKKALAEKYYAAKASEPEALDPGQERLYSYFEPPLKAGPYEISTNQVVEHEETTRVYPDKQNFNVIAPRYKLPSGSIHSVYPPPGHAENVEILPHVVLNDPQLPWTREVVKADPKDRNRIPWLAILVFTQEELKWSGLEEFPQNKVSGTLAVNLALKELESLSKTRCDSPALNGSMVWRDDDPETKADFIFVDKSLFRVLFKQYEEPNQQSYDASRYQWLAHMRHINTVGMANSGIDGEKGSFGIVVAHRAGPLNIIAPTDLIVHLVSIENIPNLDFPTRKERVALCSLDSWSYTCLPPNSFNVSAAMEDLGKTLNLFRPNLKDLERRLSSSERKLPKRLGMRLMDGYTMMRYRVQTGEETAAWIRGPFVPNIVPAIERPVSHSGTDLQVIDKETGIMDLTYGVAWQLGKTLALADQGFATALGRLKLIVNHSAYQKAKRAILKRANAYKDRDNTLSELKDALTTLNHLNLDNLMSGTDARWRALPTIAVDMSQNGSLMQKHYNEQVPLIAKRLTESTKEGVMYNEHNPPLSPDWMIVFSWILDRIYLAGIPAHHYIPDPNYLPPESLRFFHIDRNWVDAFIDGALSIANHSSNDDSIPVAFKYQINEYLKTEIEGLNYKPKRPAFGFLLRSELCIKFPDLIVEAYGADNSKPDETLILRQENIAEGVLLVLSDQRPGSNEFRKLIFREPPHQQAFSVGSTLRSNPELLTVKYKKIYTVPFEKQATLPEPTLPVKSVDFKESTRDEVFVWNDDSVNLHALRLPAYAKKIQQIMTESKETKDYYDEKQPTATLMGIQLNDPMYYLEVRIPQTIMPTLSHLHGDDGTLTGLKMLKVPKRPTRPAQDVMEVRMNVSSAQPIDWHTPFVANPVIPDGIYQHTANAGLPAAPHVRRIARTSTPLLEFYSGLGTSPKVDYQVFPLRDRKAKEISRLPYRQDLIFSLKRKQGCGDGWKLLKITVDIPYGKPEPLVPTLMDHYDGPGASMITDFRFNVAITVAPHEKKLTLTVLPRSEWSLMNNTDDLSFLLSGIVISDYDGWTGQSPYIYMNVEEQYIEHGNQGHKLEKRLKLS